MNQSRKLNEDTSTRRCLEGEVLLHGSGGHLENEFVCLCEPYPRRVDGLLISRPPARKASESLPINPREDLANYLTRPTGARRRSKGHCEPDKRHDCCRRQGNGLRRARRPSWPGDIRAVLMARQGMGVDHHRLPAPRLFAPLGSACHPSPP